MVKKFLIGLMILAVLGATCGTAISLRRSPVAADTLPVGHDVGKYSALAVDGRGAPHISYYDASAQNLKYAFQDNNAWNVVTVDPQQGTGWDTSLTFDSMGNPHISYYDSYNGDLRYAVYDGRQWQVDTVDYTGDVGRYSSIALDWTGAPHISYYDVTNGDLRYARSDGVNWWVETVDSWGNVGLYTALRLNASGHPTISYYDQTNQSTKFATYNGTFWQMQTVNTRDRVGRPGALALDSQDQPRIAYFDVNGALKVARYDLSSGDWQVDTVDSDTEHLAEASLEADSANNLWLTYYARGNLNLASFDGVVWRTGAVDTEGDVGRYSSLALSASGLMEVSYYDASNGALKFAVFDEAGWWKEMVDTEGLDVGAMPIAAAPEVPAPVEKKSDEPEVVTETALERSEEPEYKAEPAAVLVPDSPKEDVEETLLLPTIAYTSTSSISLTGDDASGYTAIPVWPANVTATGKRIYVPALGPAVDGVADDDWESWIYVQNVGSTATKATIFYWNVMVDLSGGICPGQTPDTMVASGLIPPGGMLKWKAPKEARSAIIYSVLPGSVEYPDPNDEDRPGPAAWQPPCPGGINGWEGHVDGEDLAAVIKRRGSDNSGDIESIYRGLSEREVEAKSPETGSYMYYAPLLYKNAAGFVSTLYLQNAGCECINSIELHFQENVPGCAQSVVVNAGTLPQGQSMRIRLSDLNELLDGFKGTVWIRSTEPLAVVVDHHHNIIAHMLESYQGVRGIVDPFVNTAPFLYREWNSSYPDIPVQNLNAKANALAKVYFFDASGDIIHTMVEWICPRGSHIFTLPARLRDLAEGGSVRIESHSWDADSMSSPEPVAPAHILSVVNLDNVENSQAVSYNATPYGYEEWTTLLAIPYLSRTPSDDAGTEIVLHNMNPNPGFVKVKIEFYDESGGIMYAIDQVMMGGQVDYIRLGDYGFIPPGFVGSALIRVIEGTQSVWAIEAAVIDRDYSFENAAE